MRHAFHAVAALMLGSASARAFCPSYTLSSPQNSYNCGVEAAPGSNPSPSAWQPIFALVAGGPSAWGAAGPPVADLSQGCGKPEPEHAIPARFPCEILKAIAMVESGWRQFCVPDTPADQVGGPSRTIIAFDCGYGIGQVTSGMHEGEAPAFDRNRVASDPTYNLATGAQILASKWQVAACVGDRDARVIEDWYAALWAYNGFSYVNNPSNPNYDSNRGVWDPKVGGAAPYQEKVMGWIEHPPGDPQYWQPVALAYPNPGQMGGAGSPPALAEPSCASPTDCASTRATHTSECVETPSVDAGTDAAAGSHSTDAGADAGPTLADAHPNMGKPPLARDAGNPSRLDAGSTSLDASSATAKVTSSGDEGGCGCRAARRSTVAPEAWLSLLALFGLRRRRARSRCRRA